MPQGQERKAERFVRQYVPGLQTKEDFHGQVHAVGATRAKRAMNEEIRRNA